nr:MAG TPA: hypothetical protein [Caudoviricetes sp.]
MASMIQALTLWPARLAASSSCSGVKPSPPSCLTLIVYLLYVFASYLSRAGLFCALRMLLSVGTLAPPLLDSILYNRITRHYASRTKISSKCCTSFCFVLY